MNILDKIKSFVDSLKKEENDLTVYASDISEDAIITAKENAKLNDVDINFTVGNMLEPLEEIKLDVLICNPPYIPSDEVLEANFRFLSSSSSYISSIVFLPILEALSV